jgi:MFS family permease
VGQFALVGALFLVPLFLQQARGYGAFNTGLIILPQAIAAAIFMPIGGALFDRIGARPLVIVGLADVAVAAFILSHVSATTQGIDLVLPLGMNGAGMGLMMMPLNTHIINAAPRELVSRVTSLTNAMQQVISSLTVAALATILTSRVTFHMDAVRAAFASRPTTPVPPSAAAQAAHQMAAALKVAFATAFDDTFRVMVAAAIVGAAMGLLLRRTSTPQAEEAEEDEEALAAAGMMGA